MSADIRGNAAADLEADGDLTPGEHLRAEIERLGLDQVAVSNATGVSRQSINNIVNGRQPISRAMAGKLGRLTGHSSDYWLQSSFPRVPGVSPGRSKPINAEAGALVRLALAFWSIIKSRGRSKTASSPSTRSMNRTSNWRRSI